MLKKGEHIEGVPAELQSLLDKDKEANSFFKTLTGSYKQGYCDWVALPNRKRPGKQEPKRQSSCYAINKKHLKLFKQSL